VANRKKPVVIHKNALLKVVLRLEKEIKKRYHKTTRHDKLLLGGTAITYPYNRAGRHVKIFGLLACANQDSRIFVAEVFL
jgi:hypothetical protein